MCSCLQIDYIIPSAAPQWELLLSTSQQSGLFAIQGHLGAEPRSGAAGAGARWSDGAPHSELRLRGALSTQASELALPISQNRKPKERTSRVSRQASQIQGDSDVQRSFWRLRSPKIPQGLPLARVTKNASLGSASNMTNPSHQVRLLWLVQWAWQPNDPLASWLWDRLWRSRKIRKIAQHSLLKERTTR